jgi:hypothetical protein
MGPILEAFRSGLAAEAEVAFMLLSPAMDGSGY